MSNAAPSFVPLASAPLPAPRFAFYPFNAGDGAEPSEVFLDREKALSRACALSGTPRARGFLEKGWKRSGVGGVAPRNGGVRVVVRRERLVGGVWTQAPG